MSRFVRRVLAGVPRSRALGRLLCRRFYARPFFVVGAGRSGTTILVNALGQHPGIVSRDREAPVFDRVGRIAWRYTEGPLADYFHACSALTLEETMEALRRFLFETMWGPTLGQRYFLTHPAGRSTRYWLAKAFPSREGAAGLRRLYPGTRFVYIHRDGTEVIRSRTKYKGFRSQEFEQHCETWMEGVTKYRYLAERDDVLTVRHHDLVVSPAETFDAILDHFGVPRHPAPYEYSRSTLVHSLDQETQSAADVAERFLNRPPAWEDWSGEQRETFKRICGEGMAELGYEVPF